MNYKKIQEKALFYYQQKTFQKALEYFYLLFKENPDDFNTSFYIALCWHQLNDKDKALNFYKITLEINPSLIQAYINIADLYLSEKKNDLALDFLLKSIDIIQDVELFYTIALIYHKEKKIDLALEYYLKSLNICENHLKSLYNISQLYYEKHLYSNAEIFASKAYSIEPNNYEVTITYAEILFTNNNLLKSLELFQLASLKVNSVKIEIKIIKNLIELNRNEEALFKLKEIIKNNKNNEVLELTVECFINLHLFDHAINICKILLDNDNSNLNVLYYFAYINLKLNNQVQSNYYIEEIRRFNKDEIKIYYLLAKTAFINNNLYDASNLFSRYSNNKYMCNDKYYRGQDLNNKILLIKTPKEIIEILFFYDIIKQVRNKNVFIKIVVENKYIALFKKINLFDQVISNEENLSIQYDYFVELYDLLTCFDKESNSLEYTFHLDKVNNEWDKYFFQKNKVKIGVSLTNLNRLDFLKEVTNYRFIDFYLINIEKVNEILNDNLKKCNIYDVSSELKCWDKIIDFIVNLDVVITDNDILGKLAAIINKKVWFIESKENTLYIKLLKDNSNSNIDLVNHENQNIISSDLKILLLEKLKNIEEYFLILHKVEILKMADDLVEEKDYNSAIVQYQTLLEYEPNNYEITKKVAILNKLMGNNEKAICYLKNILDLEDNHSDIYFELAQIYREEKNISISKMYIEKAISLEPNNPFYLNFYGWILNMLGDIKNAEDKYYQAIKIKEDYAEPYYNLATLINHNYHNFNLAIELCKKGIKYNPSPEGHLNLAFISLNAGDYKTGWDEYEYRKKLKNTEINFLNNEKELINQEIAGKTIYIYDEQGFGDSIQFVRYLYFLKEKKCNIIFQTKRELLDLYLGALPVDRFMTFDYMKIDKTKYDYQSALISLPRYFNTTEETIPINIPYIKINESESKKKKKQVGIVWKGRQPLDNYHRSTELKYFKKVFELNGYEFISLQKDGINIEEYRLLKKYNIKDLSSSLNSFYNTAKVINDLDYLVSIDTSVAHLGLAMGKKVLLILSRNADWRWKMKENKNLWYPNAEIFKQSLINNWEEVFENLFSYLKNSYKV